MAEKSILPPAWQVPGLFRKRLGAQVGRQRSMVAEGHLLLVLHAPPKPDDDERVGRFFWRDADGAWTAKDLGSGISALNKHLDQFDDRIAELDRQEEEASTADDYFQVLEQLTPIHRAARNLHQVLQDARKQCPDYRELIDVRDRAYSIERTAELLYSGTRNALDFTVAKRAEEQAQASVQMAVAAHRLNILAAFFFPIVTLTAIFGVDANMLSSLLRLPTKISLVGLVVLGLIAGGILLGFVTRKARAGQTRDGDRKSPRESH